MSTPELQLRTLFELDGSGSITATLEPGGSRGPLFSLIRGAHSCAWAVRAGLPAPLTRELVRLAKLEVPTSDFRAPPLYAAEYLSMLADRTRPPCDAAAKTTRSDGPAFTFPDSLGPSTDVVLINDERHLAHHFPGWVADEIADGRGPVLAVVEHGHPVSICFCARSSAVSAEAGVETASAYRGRGFAARVTAAWASTIRATGRVPLYSTSWGNSASLSVARKLGLNVYASDWSLSD